MIIRFIRLAIVSGLVLASLDILAMEDTNINKETPKMVVSIVYPQKIGIKAIDQTINHWVIAQQKAFIRDIVEKNDAPADAPGKNGLKITYKNTYNKPPAISFSFNISSFSQGAAHPNNVTITMNFIKDQKVNLDQLFKPGSKYLEKISEVAKAQIQAKKINNDMKWLNAGTAPAKDNYNKWYFTKNGLTFVMDTYQVAAYVYGPQNIYISKAVLMPMMTPAMVSAIWE